MSDRPFSRRAFLTLTVVAAGAWLLPVESDATALGPPAPEGWLHRDNDFDSPRTMAVVHQPIVDLALKVLSRDPGPILDLGSGNGALADRLAHSVPGCTPYGVELVPERAARSRRVCPKHGGNFLAGDMFSVDDVWTRDYSLVLLMPGRLIEAAPKSADLMRERLRARARNLLVYAYPDWLSRTGTLERLCESAGLRTSAVDPGCRVGLAVVG